MKCGSLADKLRDQKPVPDNSVLKYVTQLLEGVSFLHRNKIYHSDIKPANILFPADDNLKISDFAIAVGRQLQTKSSTTSSHFQGDFHYMSPERLHGADRSAANDIWTVGATVVHMISGHPLNHLEYVTQLIINISHYKLCINGNPYNDYLVTLNDNDFKKKILVRTLCNESNRTNCQQLLRILFPHSKSLPAEALMGANDERNSSRDELFLADSDNSVVRTIRLQDNAGDLREVYRGTAENRACRVSVQCVSHDRLGLAARLLSRLEELKSCAYWLVLLIREGSEWRETHRLQAAADERDYTSSTSTSRTCCALSDSRVLVGDSEEGDFYYDHFLRLRSLFKVC